MKVGPRATGRLGEDDRDLYHIQRLTTGSTRRFINSDSDREKKKA